MGISNDWQIIDNLEYETFNDTTDTKTSYGLTRESAEKIASAIGWEVVELSDYVDTVTARDLTYDSSHIRAIRPIESDEEYNTALVPLGALNYYSGGNSYYTTYIIELSTGSITDISSSNSYSVGTSPNMYILRPTAQGCIAWWHYSKISAYMRYMDKFYNPKTGVTKWGIKSSIGFVDLWTGLKITPYSPSVTNRLFNFGGFVALKKYTAISTEGIFNARTLYQKYMDYNSSEKTVELGGKKYVNVLGEMFYIPLAD
jgi:hypothetical protein